MRVSSVCVVFLVAAAVLIGEATAIREVRGNGRRPLNRSPIAATDLVDPSTTESITTSEEPTTTIFLIGPDDILEFEGEDEYDEGYDEESDEGSDEESEEDYGNDRDEYEGEDEEDEEVYEVEVGDEDEDEDEKSLVVYSRRSLADPNTEDLGRSDRSNRREILRLRNQIRQNDIQRRKQKLRRQQMIRRRNSLKQQRNRKRRRSNKRRNQMRRHRMTKRRHNAMDRQRRRSMRRHGRIVIGNRPRNRFGRKRGRRRVIRV